MRSSSFSTGLRVVAVLTVCFAGISAAHADAIQPSWTVIDLGSSGGFVNPPGHNGTVGSVNASVYAFPQTFTGAPISTPANFPLPDPVPTGPDGLPGTAYSNAGNVYLYPNGIAIAFDYIGFGSYAGPSGNWEGADIYYVRRNSDGSWGQPVVPCQQRGTRATGMAGRRT
jgi:hypothetical protein